MKVPNKSGDESSQTTPPKGAKPNKEMTKNCSPQTTPSQQNKIQTTQCPKTWAQMFCKTRVGRSPKSQCDAKSNPHHTLWNAYCGHPTQGVLRRKPSKRAKPNKEMSKNCSPQTTPSQQNKTQTTTPLAPPHLKLSEITENLNFFFFAFGVSGLKPVNLAPHFTKKPDFENNFAFATQGVVLLWFFYSEAKKWRAF